MSLSTVRCFVHKLKNNLAITRKLQLSNVETSNAIRYYNSFSLTQKMK